MTCVCTGPLCLQVLTLPAFPTSVMGTVVNKRAKYNYLRLVQDSEKLTYRCAPAGNTCHMASDGHHYQRAQGSSHEG